MKDSTPRNALLIYPPLEGGSKSSLRAGEKKISGRGVIPAEYPSPKNSPLRSNFSTLPQGEGGVHRTNFPAHATGTAIEVNGEELLLDAAGALFWPAEETLVFADLHFEKGSSFAKGGQMLPPYDTRVTLKRMEALILRHAPKRVIALGDSFHDREAADRLDDCERAQLLALAERARWIWIAGNHDPVPPSWLGGIVREEVAIGGLVFRHEPLARGCPGEIAGHLHPCATVTRRGRSLRRRCFASDGLRLVMPAFGAYAGGLDVREPPLRTLFAQSFFAYLLGSRRVYAVPGH